MYKNIAIVLAAGKGSRMKSGIPKPLHKINGKTMVYTLIEKIYISNLFDKILVVIGINSKDIIENLEDFKSKITYIIQKEQNGTGHALKCCKNYLKNYKVYRSLILFADCPLLSINTMKLILEKKDDCIACICEKENPFGNGRIILNNNGNILNSIEEKDCNEEQKKIRLVNVGIYLIKNNLIIEHIDKVKNNNKQKEYYLPDLMIILIQMGYKVIHVKLENQNELINVNTPEDLAKAKSIDNN
tara:strand:- start:952 stop:1683 length:732 start_codon:yes stop_codon:yes gene_type:complete